jgi:hypothetical protein
MPGRKGFGGGRAKAFPGGVAWMAVSALWLLIGAAPLVDAYVLQGGHVLELMIEAMGSSDRLMVEQERSDPARVDTDPPPPALETVNFAFPDRCRLDATDGTVFMIEGGQSALFKDNQAVAEERGKPRDYIQLLLYRERTLLANCLTSMGVAVDISSLAREGDRVFYVVGAQYPDDTVPQLWVDKTTFKPFRLFVKAPSAPASSPPSVEYRFLEWLQTGDIWYPKHIEIRQNTITTDDIRVISTRIDSPVTPDFFSIGKHMAEAGALKAPEEPSLDSSGGGGTAPVSVPRFPNQGTAAPPQP